MTSPLAMLDKINNRGRSEESILRALANSGQTREFYELTNIGCFERIDVWHRKPKELIAPQQEIDNVLRQYGIAPKDWERVEMPCEACDADHMCRYKYTNGVVDINVYGPR